MGSQSGADNFDISFVTFVTSVVKLFIFSRFSRAILILLGFAGSQRDAKRGRFAYAERQIWFELFSSFPVSAASAIIMLK